MKKLLQRCRIDVKHDVSTCEHKSSANPLSENQAVAKEDDRGQDGEEFPVFLIKWTKNIDFLMKQLLKINRITMAATW